MAWNAIYYIALDIQIKATSRKIFIKISKDTSRKTKLG